MDAIKISSIDDFPILSGIYKFTNKVNGKIYIGESLNFKQRMHGHVTKSRDVNWTAVIARAFRKYGFSNFEYEIIENYPHKSVTKDFLIEREAFYIKNLDAMNPEKGYNRCPYGVNTIGYKFSEESRKKMSVARKKRVMRRESIEKQALTISGDKNWNYGKSMPEDHKKKLFDIVTTREITEEERQSKSIGHIKSENKPRKSICQLDKTTGEVLHIWRSISDAIRSLGKSSPSDLVNSMKFPHKTAYGFKWRFLTEEEKSTAVLETFYKEGLQCKRHKGYKRKAFKD